jgi:hypothetical protein
MFAAVAAVVVAVGLTVGTVVVNQDSSDQQLASSAQEAVVTVEGVHPTD